MTKDEVRQRLDVEVRVEAPGYRYEPRPGERNQQLFFNAELNQLFTVFMERVRDVWNAFAAEQRSAFREAVAEFEPPPPPKPWYALVEGGTGGLEWVERTSGEAG